MMRNCCIMPLSAFSRILLILDYNLCFKFHFITTFYCYPGPALNLNLLSKIVQQHLLQSFRKYVMVIFYQYVDLVPVKLKHFNEIETFLLRQVIA